MAMEVGAIVEGKVEGITNFGAFVRLESCETGMVHISEVADSYVKDINEHLKIGQTVKVRVMKNDAENGRLSLSIRRAQPVKAPTAPPVPAWNKPVRPASNASFDDLMSRFMKDSEERQQDVRRHSNKKRGSSFGRGK